MMKGKSIFTKAEADQIIALIEQKLVSESSKQKGIRDKIRKLGFYAKDDFGLGGGYTVADFRRVVRIVGTLSPVNKPEIKKTRSSANLANTPKSSTTSLNFDNEITDELRLNGFKGFKTIAEIVKNNYADIPKVKGIYILLHQDITPEFVEVGPGGHFKAKNPNVSIDLLKENWIENSSIVYIGKAGAEDGNATLHSRLKQYFRFGHGSPVGHWGGRYVWQLKNCYDMVVCWKELPAGNPRDEESKLIKEFVNKYGKRPFANLKD